ncbi:MAG: lipid IV(A) 3-deoxy-D-manno-octulosonic acid transferase [Nitrosomonadales bacterium]|nr:lipid IV(A) 3-deoxy-D-manno-octulosonic acid transferase [Nitrosomonadales bacterium]
MRNTRFFYTIGLWLLLPYIFFHLLWRARKQPEYLKHIAERFGFYSTHSDKPVIWLHTVSVGETRAAASLVQRLRETYPDHQLLLTHTTPTGRAASEQLYGGDVLRVYLPYDYPFAIRRFLNHFRPRIGVLLETEIWFNLIYACNAEKTPLLLLNARLSEKSALGYARVARLTRNALRELAAIAAQTTDDAARLTALGAGNVSVMGNLKFDIEPPAAMPELGKELRIQFGAERKVFLAASTREGEEALLLDVLKQVDMPHLLTVIVPRHPQRFDEVATLLTRHGTRFQRRSENRPVAPDTQVVLGDSMGEMFAYYAACDLAFIGGSLLPFGGQNLIEACAAGKPVLIGPHTYNFAQASQLAVASGAALRVQDTMELAQTLQNLLSHPHRMAEIGAAGLRFVSANRGATEHALLHINQCITK